MWTRNKGESSKYNKASCFMRPEPSAYMRRSHLAYTLFGRAEWHGSV